MITQQSSQIYYTKQEASAYTRHASRTLEYAVARGELRAFKPSRKLLFVKSDLDHWIQRCLAGADLNRIVDETMREVLSK